MKVVFLDVDGVLNHKEWMSKLDSVLRMADDDWWIEMLDPLCVDYLNLLLDQSGAKVVLSSSWRLNFDAQGMQRLLEAVGFKGEIIDCTTKEHMDCRGFQIAEWLDNHSEDIETFVILDDRNNMAHLKPYLVQTPHDDGGLQDCHVMRAVEILKNQKVLQ